MYFSLLIAIGSGAGLFWIVRRAPSEQASSRLSAGLMILTSALLFGRAVHVAASWAYYRLRPAEIFQVWLGGLSGIGALAGAIFGLLTAAIALRTSIGRLADVFLPLLTSITVAAWLACWLTGSAYGHHVEAWWGIPARDEWGTVSQRFPVQLLGALGTVALFWVTERLRPSLPHAGQAAGLNWLGLSLLILGLSFLRADPAPSWSGLRPETWGGIGLLTMALIGLALATFLPSPEDDDHG